MEQQPSKKPEITIAVAAYNVAKYVAQCLDSIMDQTFQDWECIIYDDGSTDTTGKICDEIAARDSRFKVIHSENRGIAEVRNKAVENVSGKYFTFVDADDWLEPEYLKVLYELITEYQADVAQCDFFLDYTTFSEPLKAYTKIEVLNQLQFVDELRKDHKVRSYLWNKLYRTEVVKPSFPQEKAFTDFSAFSEWASRIHKFVMCPIPLYHYRMRKSSIMNTNYRQHQLNYINACLKRADTFANNYKQVFPDNIKQEYIIETLITGAKRVARGEKDSLARHEGLKEISSKLIDFKMPSLKRLGLKKWVRGKLLKDHPASFSILIRFENLFRLRSNHNSDLFFD